MLKEHIYSFNKVVIGNNLDAILYAYKTNSHILLNDVASIFSFDAILHEIDLGDVKFASGSNKLEVWKQVSYMLNMRGLNPFGGEIESIRLNLEENEISIFSKFFSRQILRFSTLHVFDTEKVHGLPIPDIEATGYRVFDWFAVKSGTKHDYDCLEDNSDLVKKIHFYLSPRIAGNKQYKDLVAESLLTKKQLGNVDYSDSISRLKVLHMMKEAGIKGTSNGNNYHLPLKIELQKREILPLKVTNYGEEGIIL